MVIYKFLDVPEKVRNRRENGEELLPEMLLLDSFPRMQPCKGKSSIWVHKLRLSPKAISPLTSHE